MIVGLQMLTMLHLLQLYWLPISFIIDFKILLLVFKALTGLASVARVLR